MQKNTAIVRVVDFEFFRMMILYMVSRLETVLLRFYTGPRVNAPSAECLANNLNLRFSRTFMLSKQNAGVIF